MNVETHERDSQLSARRRLIRGAFAAPAALTLYSGSVAARSINNCVTRQVSTPDLTPSTPTPEAGTTYVRVQLQKFQNINPNLQNLDRRYSRWVRGTDVYNLRDLRTTPPGGTVFVTTGQWYQYDRGNLSRYVSATPVPVGGTISTTPTESVATNPQNTSQTADQWVALRVNANGDILGVVGIVDNSGSAVWQSCWSSFRIG